MIKSRQLHSPKSDKEGKRIKTSGPGGSGVGNAISLLGVVCTIFMTGIQIEAFAQSPLAASGEDSVMTVLPGDKRFNTPDFDDFEVVYTSSSSQNGEFTMQARQTGDGKKLTLIDIIPMKENVIVAQRVINLKTHRAEFSAQPYFAWGAEFVVGQSSPQGYDWTRIPIGGGEAKRMTGAVENGGYVDVMFTPTLAALMPMEIGELFRMPEAYPRKGEFVSSEFNEYEVLRQERLDLPSGLSCDCWMIEKRAWNDTVSHYWVAREAPFVFRRIRNVGSRREMVSDALGFRLLDE